MESVAWQSRYSRFGQIVGRSSGYGMIRSRLKDCVRHQVSRQRAKPEKSHGTSTLWVGLILWSEGRAGRSTDVHRVRAS